jgi:hypothetical protein
MNTYNKTLNIIDYTVMGLLSVNVILAALNIPYAFNCFVVLWLLSMVIFIATSIKSKLYNISIPLFILDIICKNQIFGGILLLNGGDASKNIGLGISIVLVVYLIDSLLTKNAPVYRSVSYLLIYAITTGVCAAITM